MATTTKKTTTTKSSTKTTKLTPFEQEQIEVLKRINEYKVTAEANVVSILYKEPDLLRETNLVLEEFSNNVWRVFFTIASDLVLVEKKNSLDQITVNLYLEKHKLLIAGDALTIQDGKLIKTSEQLNYDNTSYNQSLEKISNLTINTIICYHGGILTIDELKF
jgi:hypothetical protein